MRTRPRSEAGSGSVYLSILQVSPTPIPVAQGKSRGSRRKLLRLEAKNFGGVFDHPGGKGIEDVAGAPHAFRFRQPQHASRQVGNDDEPRLRPVRSLGGDMIEAAQLCRRAQWCLVERMYAGRGRHGVVLRWFLPRGSSPDRGWSRKLARALERILSILA